MAEEARLESVYTPKGYPEFESRSLRKVKYSELVILSNLFRVFFVFIIIIQFGLIIMGQVKKSVEMLKIRRKVCRV